MLGPFREACNPPSRPHVTRRWCHKNHNQGCTEKPDPSYTRREFAKLPPSPFDRQDKRQTCVSKGIECSCFSSAFAHQKKCSKAKRAWVIHQAPTHQKGCSKRVEINPAQFDCGIVSQPWLEKDPSPKKWTVCDAANKDEEDAVKGDVLFLDLLVDLERSKRRAGANKRRAREFRKPS